ncbi:MAG: DUF6616 family protein [Anaerolineae bacterium]
MAEAVYKVWKTRPTEAWYRLSKEARETHLAKMRAALEDVGGSSLLTCTSDWSSEAWRYFGIEFFPNTDAVKAYARRLHALDHYRYFRSESTLGTKIE